MDGMDGGDLRRGTFNRSEKKTGTFIFDNYFVEGNKRSTTMSSIVRVASYHATYNMMFAAM